MPTPAPPKPPAKTGTVPPTPKPVSPTISPRSSVLGVSDLYILNTVGRTTSVMLNLALAQQQSAISQTLQLYAERMKSQQSREQTLKALQSAIAKIDSEMSKNRVRTAQDVNKAVHSMLLGK